MNKYFVTRECEHIGNTSISSQEGISILKFSSKRPGYPHPLDIGGVLLRCSGNDPHSDLYNADSCRYDVILGADFLSKTGIDVKYSTGAIE